MKYFIVSFLLFYQQAFTQQQVSGIVLNAEDNSKLISASVFINNSSKGTITNADGKFVIYGLTETNFELVISYIGFLTVSINITSQNINEVHTIKLYPRKQELAEISVSAPEKNGWRKWGKLFTENFIGTSDFASVCKIENPEVIRFFRDKKTSTLHAYSNDAIRIKNRALGYNIKYQLEDFTYDPYNKRMFYIGYTVFENFKTNNKNRKGEWEKNRKQAYEGSILHFMRSLYKDSLKAQHFNVREKIKIYDSDTLYQQIYHQSINFSQSIIVNNKFYIVKYGAINPVKERPDYIVLIDTAEFSFKKAITFYEIKKQKKLSFQNYLEVTYNKVRFNSDITLVNDGSLIIDENGFYFSPIYLLTSGYWSTQRMAELLPTDYINK